jgi:hypothetical protein
MQYLPASAGHCFGKCAPDSIQHAKERMRVSRGRAEQLRRIESHSGGEELGWSNVSVYVSELSIYRPVRW